MADGFDKSIGAAADPPPAGTDAADTGEGVPPTSPVLGDLVVYTDGAGFQTLGLVAATSSTKTDGNRPAPDTYHLALLGANYRTVPSVVEGDGPRAFLRLEN